MRENMDFGESQDLAKDMVTSKSPNDYRRHQRGYWVVFVRSSTKQSSRHKERFK